ncbi:MAG: sulfatase family protein, partial [Anaerolineae bacterium]
LELYDLQEDPWELRNVAEDPAFADTRRDLLRRLHAHMVETEDPLLHGAITCPQHRVTQALLEEAAES